MVSILIVLGAMVVLCFLCSMAEAALLSIPALRVRIMLEQRQAHAKTLSVVKENIAAAVATIVIINNTINIVGSIYIGHAMTGLIGDEWLGAISGVLTFIIIVFGEVIPKAIGERFKVPLALLFARPVRVLMWLMHPVVVLIQFFARPWHHGEQTRVTEDEIKMMLKFGRDSGTVESDEEILINRVFKLNDLRALNIMRPLNEAYMFEAGRTLGECKEAILQSPYNRVLVYEGSKNNVIGVVQIRVLLREIAKDNHVSHIRDWMLKPVFVNQMTRADVLMEKFQAFHQHLFVVQDNLARNVGLVTMEDIFEELFGEIYDEKDIRFRTAARKPS